MRPKRFVVCVQGGHADGLRSVPFIRALRRAAPNAHITVLAYEFARDLWTSCPYVDDFVATGEDSVLGRGWEARIKKVGRIAVLAARLFARYDVFLNLEVQAEGGFPGLLAICSAAPIRVGHGGLRSGMNRSPGRADMRVPYEDRMRELMGELGVSVTDTSLEAWCGDQDRHAVRDMLMAAGWHPGRRLVVCHAGSDWSCQTWAAGSWVTVARSLIRRHDAIAVFTGVESEAASVDTIVQRCGGASINLCGQTSFGQLCALLEMADLVISGDTVVAPLALAMGAPTMTLAAYDTSNWSVSRLRELNAISGFEVREPLPWSVRCHWNRIGRVHGCISESCVGIHGMGRIQPGDVLDQAESIIARAEAQLGAVQP
jgi:ADP-heptose:LPS heptosyltransferase